MKNALFGFEPEGRILLCAELPVDAVAVQCGDDARPDPVAHAVRSRAPRHYAVLRAAGLPGPALAGRVAYRCILAALAALAVLGVAVSALLVSALGSTTAGRSTYFGASAASALFDASLASGGRRSGPASSTPPSERLRSPAWAAADAKTNPAIRMNLRMFVSPLEVEAETMPGRTIPMRGRSRTAAVIQARRRRGLPRALLRASPLILFR